MSQLPTDGGQTNIWVSGSCCFQFMGNAQAQIQIKSHQIGGNNKVNNVSLFKQDIGKYRSKTTNIK